MLVTYVKKFSLQHFGKIRIGVAEKGYATLELSVKMTAGHSSVPPRETALGVLAGAVSRLERNPQVDFGFHFLELKQNRLMEKIHFT